VIAAPMCAWRFAYSAETYHVPGTHPEFMKFGDFRGWARAQGKHSNIGYDAPKDLKENQAKLRLGAGADPRVSTAEMQLYTWEHVNTNTTRSLGHCGWSTSYPQELRPTRCSSIGSTPRGAMMPRAG